MMPRPALSMEWTALRSASKSLCWDAKFLTSDLKCEAVSSVIRPRHTKVKVPSGQIFCTMVRPCSGPEAGFDIQIPPKGLTALLRAESELRQRETSLIDGSKLFAILMPALYEPHMLLQAFGGQ